MSYFLKRISCLFVLFLLFTPIYADSASSELSGLLKDTNSLQAAFDQKVMDSNGKILQSTSGFMRLQRPGKFRWETTFPDKQLLIADGKKIWFYDAGLSQVTTQKQQAENTTSPAMLLSGSSSELIKKFAIEQLPSPTKNKERFKLSPKNKSQLFQSVELIFNNHQLYSMRLFDNLNQKTVITFSKVKENPKFSSDLFKFILPKGVDVVSQ